jgi:hypothetical protein
MIVPENPAPPHRAKLRGFGFHIHMWSANNLTVRALRQQREAKPTAQVVSSRSKFRLQSQDQGRLVAELLELKATLNQEALAPRTFQNHETSWRAWLEFCHHVGLDQDAFGTIPASQPGPTAIQLADENDILCLFAIFVVFYPMRVGQEMNRAKTAENYLGAVRVQYEPRLGRRPGAPMPGVNSYASSVKRVFRALHKRAPSERNNSFPLLQHHLRALKRRLNLEGSAHDRCFWHVVLSAWQGVLRLGDLIQGKRERGQPWVPAKQTTLSRFRREESIHSPSKKCYVLKLKPTKTDQAEEEGWESYFPIDYSDDALSAGAVFEQRFRAGDFDGADGDFPVFYTPKTGREITYDQCRACLISEAPHCGIPVPAARCQSLRKGGNSAAIDDPNGGEITAAFMGHWKHRATSSQSRYSFGLRARTERTATSMARASSRQVGHY